MIDLKTNAGPELERLGNALARVEGLGRRSGAELVRRAAADILLGSKGTGNGSGAYKGLHQEFDSIRPDEGDATAEAQARDWRVGTGTASYLRGLEKAKSVLGGEESGVFMVATGHRGRVQSPKRVYVATRGKRKGQLSAHTGRGRLPKTAIAAQGGSVLGAIGTGGLRSAYRARGWSILNLHALAVAFALSYRESARGATAAQFLPKKYRRELLRRDPKTANAAAWKSVNIPLTNKGGNRIGALDMQIAPHGSYARIMGDLGVPQRFYGTVKNVVNAVALDRETYLMKKQIQQELRKR